MLATVVGIFVAGRRSKGSHKGFLGNPFVRIARKGREGDLVAQHAIRAKGGGRDDSAKTFDRGGGALVGKGGAVPVEDDDRRLLLATIVEGSLHPQAIVIPTVQGKHAGQRLGFLGVGIKIDSITRVGSALGRDKTGTDAFRGNGETFFVERPLPFERGHLIRDGRFVAGRKYAGRKGRFFPDRRVIVARVNPEGRRIEFRGILNLDGKFVRRHPEAFGVEADGSGLEAVSPESVHPDEVFSLVDHDFDVIGHRTWRYESRQSEIGADRGFIDVGK